MYKDVDDCNDTCTFYDYQDLANDSETCSHKEFQNLTPIQKLERFQNKSVPTCCEGHAYMFYDNCRSRVKFILFRLCISSSIGFSVKHNILQVNSFKRILNIEHIFF